MLAGTPGRAGGAASVAPAPVPVDDSGSPITGYQAQTSSTGASQDTAMALAVAAVTFSGCAGVRAGGPDADTGRPRPIVAPVVHRLHPVVQARTCARPRVEVRVYGPAVREQLPGLAASRDCAISWWVTARPFRALMAGQDTSAAWASRTCVAVGRNSPEPVPSL